LGARRVSVHSMRPAIAMRPTMISSPRTAHTRGTLFRSPPSATALRHHVRHA
jgi:hypothetical protein